MAKRPSPVQRLAAGVLAGVTRALFGMLRLMGPDRASMLGGRIARKLGPWLPQHRKVGRPNLAAAFPEKSGTEREAILLEAWDNLGRLVAEYPFLSDLVDFDPATPDAPTRMEFSGREHFDRLAATGGPALIFSAHTGNWELIGVAAARYGLDAAVIFRPPNSEAARRVVAEMRSKTMGRMIASNFGAGAAIVDEVTRGGVLGMLIDQHFTLGVRSAFFGRPVMTNPLLARLARRFDCPVHGARCVRLPGGRFRLEITPSIDLPRDDEGKIDVEGAVAAMNAIIERWVRENPGQWLWFHRRWRVT